MTLEEIKRWAATEPPAVQQYVGELVAMVESLQEELFVSRWNEHGWKETYTEAYRAGVRRCIEYARTAARNMVGEHAEDIAEDIQKEILGSDKEVILYSSFVEVVKIVEVLELIISDATGDNPQKRIWPIKAQNYRDAKIAIAALRQRTKESG